MMESGDKGRNPWRKNQTQVRTSNSYRQTSAMPQDTGVTNNYNHFGQPAYQVSRMQQSTWYGSRPNPEPTPTSDSWNWGIEPQQNPGQHFQEAYHAGGQTNFPQQTQQQPPLYQGYGHHHQPNEYHHQPNEQHHQPNVDASGQQVHMQWHGMYQGQHGAPINNMGYQQYDQSNPSTVDNMNQANVGNVPGTGNGNGSGDLWNWGIEDSQGNAGGEWGGNEEAWDWAIPGADTPTSVPTPAPTPGPPPQRLVQGSAEEVYQPSSENLQISETSSVPQINQHPSSQDEAKHNTSSYTALQKVPNPTDVNVLQVSNEVKSEGNNAESWCGWSDPSFREPSEKQDGENASPLQHKSNSSVTDKDNGGNMAGWIDIQESEAVIKQDETKMEKKSDRGYDSLMRNVEISSSSQQTAIQQEDKHTTENIPQNPHLEPSLENYQQPKSEHLPSVPENRLTENPPPFVNQDINQNTQPQDTAHSSELERNELSQDFSLLHHTDANHNELLLLEVRQQLNEETHSYDQWWQTPERNLPTSSTSDGSQLQKINSEAESRKPSAEVNQLQSEAKQGSPQKLETQAAHSSSEIQWPQRLEGNNIIQLTEELASFTIGSKREMGEGTPAEEESNIPISAAAISQDELALGVNKELRHEKDLSEDGANLETLPDNKERLDDEEPASKYPHQSEREPAAAWSQGITQPENQEVAPPKVEMVPSSNSSFVQWQAGGVRQRSPEEGGQEARSTAKQGSLRMAARKGAPSPRPTLGLSPRPAHMVGSREDNRAPRPKYLQTRDSPSPTNVTKQQTSVDPLVNKNIAQQRPQTSRRSNDDTPLPSDRNQYLETGQLRDEEEDEEDEDPCGPPSSQRPPPGLRRMVPGESSSPEAGGVNVSGSGICHPVTDPDELVDDDDDDALDIVQIPTGPRVVPGVAEGEEENPRDDGVGQVPEGVNSSSSMNSGVVQPVAEVPNSERSETIGSEGGVVPTIMPMHPRDTVEDRRGSYSRVDSRRDVSSERERSITHPKNQPQRVGDNVGAPHIVGGSSGLEDEDDSKDGDRGMIGRHGRRRTGRGGRVKDREEGELSEDEDGDDGTSRKSAEERHGEVNESSRSRRRDHGKSYGGSKVDSRRVPRDDLDSGDDHLDDRSGRDDGRRDERKRGDRRYDDQWSRRSRRRGYDQDIDPDEDGYYRNHPPRRRGSNEWDRHRHHSIPPEERGHHDERGGGRHDYPSQDWSREHRHRDWGPEDEYSRDYYNHRHPSSVSGRQPQPYYSDCQRSRTNSQLDLGGNAYDGRPSSRGGEGYYSDTNRDGGWERRNRASERGGARMRRESGERDDGDWHERDSRTPRHHYPHPYSSHHLRAEPPYYGGDSRYGPDSRQFSPYSPGYDYYGHPLPSAQLPHHSYYSDPYRMPRDPFGHAYIYLEEMRRTRPHEYAEWYRKVYGRGGGSHAGVAGSTGTPGGRTPSASGGAASPVGIPRSDIGEGVHSLDEAIAGDDGRGSVHSGRSSLNLLQPNLDDDSNSGRKHSADRSLGSPYTGLEQVSSRASTPQRATPTKFPSAHIKGVLTAHGSLILLRPNYLLDGPSSSVEFISLRELLKNDPIMAELEDFPGPLVRGSTHKNSVIQFCNSKINAASNDANIQDHESYILLWKLLILLLKQNGFVVGTDISNLLLEDSAYLKNPTQDSVTGSMSPQLVQEELSSNSNLTTPDEGIVAGGSMLVPSLGNRVPQFSEEYLTRKFREYLLFGNTRDALEWAMKHGLWGHAMFLAYKIGGRMLASVLTRFANNLPQNDPLQTLYQLLSGKQPGAITSCSDEKWGDWRPHLAMIISNSSSHPDLHRKSIITLGDTLAARGCPHASQFCYIIATLNLCSSPSGTPSSNAFGVNTIFSGPDSRLILLGSSIPLSYDSDHYIPNEVVHFTEVLEYARSLAEPNFCIPYFQPIKLQYAMRLVEHGLVQEGLLYCEAIANKVTTWLMSGGLDKSIDIKFLKRLFEFSDRLKHHDPVLERNEGAGEEDPQWLQQLKTCIKMLEGQPQGVPTGMQQTTDMTGLYGTQPGMDMHGGQMAYGVVASEGVSNTQTELSGHGVMQTGEYEAQWNSYYYEQAKWQQQQQQQQQIPQPKQDQTGSVVDSVAPPAMEANQIATPYEGTMWDSTAANTMVADGLVSVSNEGQEDIHQQTKSGIPSTQETNSLRMGNMGQPSADGTMPVSENTANNYWDMATNNDQSGRGVRREEDDDDEEDDEDSEEEEEDYEDENPPKDVSGRQRQPSGSSASNRNWNRTNETVLRGRKDSLDGKGAGSSVQGGGGSSGGGWFGGLLSKFSLRPKNQMNLPDDKNPSIVWDNEKKRWVNMDADEDEATGDLPPPPKASDLIPTVNTSVGAVNSLTTSGNINGKSTSESIPTLSSLPPSGNMYKMQKGRKMRQNYVDVMGSSTTKAGGRGNIAPPPDLFPTQTTTAPGNFFIPTPVHDNSAPTDFLTSAPVAENEVQESSEKLMYQENQYHQQPNMHY